MFSSNELILNWLNKEIQLDPPVKDIVREFCTGYRFSEILYKINLINEKQFKEFSNSPEQYNIKQNFILVKKYFKDLFELEIRAEEFNDIINKDRAKTVIVLYKLKNSISKKNINFLNVKISLNKLTQEEIQQKVEDIINYEFFNNFNTDLLYDIVNEENNINLENNKFKFSSTIKSFNSNLFNNFPFQGKISQNSIDENPEIKLRLLNSKEKPKNYLLYNRNINTKSSLNTVESKKEIKLPNIVNMYKSTEIISPNKNLYMKTEQSTSINKLSQNSLFITSDNAKNNFYKTKIKFGNGKSRIAEENKFKITQLTDTLYKFGLKDFQSNFKQTLPEFNPSNKKELEKVRVELKNKISLKKPESKKKIEKEKKELKIREYDVPEIDFVHKEKNPLYKYKLPIGISLFKHNKYLTFPKRLKYSKEWKIYYNQKIMEKKIKFFSYLIKKSIKKDESKKENNFFDKDIFFSNMNLFNTDKFNDYLMKKKLKYKRDIPLIRNMLLEIVDMTMEVFFYKEENDAELIDIETYTKLLELFINNKPMRERVVDKEARIIKERNNESDEINPEKLVLNEEEINLKEDYKNYIGMYNDDKIMNKEFRGMKIDFKKIISIFPSDYEPTENDLENLIFPKFNIENKEYGEIILELLDNKYSPKSKGNASNETGKWDHIGYKLALIGLPFCGKKFVAQELNKKYPNLKIYSAQKLLRNYYEQYKNISEPIENNPKFKSLKPNQIEQLKQEKETKIKEFEPIQQLIQPYINSLNQNNSENNEKEKNKEIENKTIFPSDEVLLKIILYNIEKDFPKLSEEAVKNEIIKTQKNISDLLKQKENLEKQIKENKKPNPKDDQLLSNIIKDIENIKNNSVKGFILVDFPTNINQCNLLEFYLNGYVDETQKPKSQKISNVESINSLIDFNFIPNEKNTLKKAGIDFIINIISNEEDNNERFSNIKYDPLNDKIYSQYELSQDIVNKDKKLMERLVDNIPYYTKEHFDYYKKEYIENISKINLFYNMFGFSKNNNIDMDSNMNAINIEKYEKDIQRAYQEIDLEEESKKETGSITNSSIDEKNEIKKEANVNNNKDINNMIKKEDEIKNKIINYINDNIIKVLFDIKTENDKKIFYTKFPELNDEEEKDKIKFEPDHKINEIRATLSTKNTNMNINKDKYFIKSLTDNFDSVLSDLKLFNDYYEKHAGKFIYLIKKQKNNIYIRLNLIQKKYRDFLNLKSDKKEVIALYCDKYNAFFTEFPNAFNSQQAIDEFNHNINELNSTLWRLINIKETVSIKELQEIKNSNFIEYELKKFYKNIKEIFLLETERFLMMINSIINLYQKRHSDESTSTIINMIKNNKEKEIEKEKAKKLNINKIIFNKEYILKDLIEISNINLYDEENENENEIDNNYDIKKNDIKNRNIFYEKKNEPNSIDYLINKNTEIIFNNCINLIQSQEEKIENLMKSIKEWINFGNKKIKIKKKFTQQTFSSSNSGLIQSKETEAIEENIRKMFNNEKNKYKYRICFLRSFVTKYLIIIIHTSIKIFQNIDSWITKSVTLQSEAQDKVIQKIKRFLKEKKLIDIHKDIFTIELDSFEPSSNIAMSSNNNSNNEILLTPRDKNLEIYEKLNIDYLVNNSFINIEIKEDKDFIADENDANKNIFNIKKYKIIEPNALTMKNDVNNLGKSNISKAINYKDDDFYYDFSKFMGLYNMIKKFEVKKSIISETIFYQQFIKNNLFNKKLFYDDNDNSNNLLTINEEIKQKEKQNNNNNNNNNKNLKSSLKSNVNNIISFPLICKALRNLNYKNVRKLLSLFRINIEHKSEDKINVNDDVTKDKNDSITSNINIEQSEKDLSKIEYDNYLNNSEIFTLLSLIGCKILTEKKEKEIMSILKNKIINDKFLPKNEFFKFSFWFESDFEYINLNSNKNNNKFKRNTMIKTKTIYKKVERKSTKQSPSSSSKLEKICNINSEDNTTKTIKHLLFNIWKDEKGNNFNIKDFINVLKPIKYKNNYQEKDDERYFDIIFNN